MRIEDTRGDEPAFLDSLLTGSSSVLRAAASVTAGRLGGAVHRPALRGNAADVNPQVAARAFFALAMLKDSGSVAIAARGLRRAPAIAEQAAFLLGELGEAGRAALVDGLHDSSVSVRARQALLLAAARLRPVPASAVSPWVSAPDTALSWRAAYALARGRSAAGVRTLLDASASPSAALREQIARGLSRNAAGDSLGARAQAALAILVRDTAPHVRINAIRSLASYGVSARTPVLHALRDHDPAVRLTSAQALDLVLDSTSGPWRDALAMDASFVVQRAVLEGAAHHTVRGLVPEAWSSSDDWLRRAAAAELDAAGPSAPALAAAQRWLADRDGRVRAAAAASVARLADSAVTRVTARRALTALLRDGDVQVRAAALGGLASGATANDLAQALESRALGARDADNDARLAFWTLADSALRSSQALPDSVEQRLAAIPEPADPLERAAASRIGRFAGWKAHSGTARPFAWYESRAREAMSDTQTHATIVTERGSMELLLFGSDAVLTVYNFVTLARARYFDGLRFHRVVPGFVAQAGDPRGDGNGGPGYAIRDEINPHRYERGTLGMALSGPHTGGSQFFITHSPQPHLDGGYTVFGQLESGGDVLDRIVQGDRIVRLTIH